MPKITPPYLSPALLNRDISHEQDEIYHRLGAEMSSGGVSEDFSSVLNMKQFLDQEVMLNSVTNYRQNNQLSQQKIAYISNNLGTLKDVNKDYKEQIIAARSGGMADLSGFQIWAKEKLSYLNSVLNTTFNGQYVFSGTATTTQSVLDLSTLGTASLGAAVDNTYYLGATQSQQFKADDYQTIQINVQGNDPGIAKLIMALRSCLVLDPDPTVREQQFKQAMDYCDDSLYDLLHTQAHLDYQFVTLTSVDDKLQEMDQRLQENIKEIGYRPQTDVFQEFIQAKTNITISNYVTMSYLNAIRDLIDRIPT